jgi:hypothetical protein
MTIVYHDDYRRDDGDWYFRNRRLTEWYAVDVLERPQAGPLQRWPGRPERGKGRLPNLFPTWDPFWEAAGAEVRDRRTSRP